MSGGTRSGIRDAILLAVSWEAGPLGPPEEWPLVAAPADEWGTRPTPSGKSVLVRARDPPIVFGR